MGAHYYEGEGCYHRYDNCPESEKAKAAGKVPNPLRSRDGQVIYNVDEKGEVNIVGVDLTKPPQVVLPVCPVCEKMGKG